MFYKGKRQKLQRHFGYMVHDENDNFLALIVKKSSRDWAGEA